MTSVYHRRMLIGTIIVLGNLSKKNRFRAFGYRPKDFPHYLAVATRKEPGQQGLSWEKEDWVEDEATSHRGPR